MSLSDQPDDQLFAELERLALALRQPMSSDGRLRILVEELYPINLELQRRYPPLPDY
jgi:hypothetical protein